MSSANRSDQRSLLWFALAYFLAVAIAGVTAYATAKNYVPVVAAIAIIVAVVIVFLSVAAIALNRRIRRQR
jgi:membrane protein YdbS with pleckstrin-like domain